MRAPWLVTVLLVGLVVPIRSSGESLADAAKREKERRQKNKDTGVKAREVSEQELQETKGQLAAPMGGGSAATAPGSSTPGTPADNKSPNKDRPASSDDEAAKRETAADIHRRLVACEADLKRARQELQEAENALPTAPVMLTDGDTSRRAHAAWEAAVRNARTAAQGIEQRCHDIEAEPVRKGIPPGWVRDAPS
jgi:hypothetical protein